ncbi:hypothetical protein SMICM17S_00995 [Streptomyces microflavus]
MARLSRPAFFQARMSVSCTTSSARWRSPASEPENVREQRPGMFAVERPHQLLVRYSGRGRGRLARCRPPVRTVIGHGRILAHPNLLVETLMELFGDGYGDRAADHSTPGSIFLPGWIAAVSRTAVGRLAGGRARGTPPVPGDPFAVAADLAGAPAAPAPARGVQVEPVAGPPAQRRSAPRATGSVSRSTTSLATTARSPAQSGSALRVRTSAPPSPRTARGPGGAAAGEGVDPVQGVPVAWAAELARGVDLPLRTKRVGPTSAGPRPPAAHGNG